MADNLDNSSLGNFSIQDTMEMGMGSAELLNDLMGPETSTSNPDDLKKIVNEVEEDKIPTASTKAPKGKEITPLNEGEENTGQNSISDFLGDSDNEEDEEETSKKVNAPTEATDEEATEEDVSKFGALSNDLFKLGVFTKEDDEDEDSISTPEEFLERFQAEKKKGAIEVVNNFIGQFGEDYQEAFDAIFVKGVNPKEYFSAYNNVVSFTELDLSDEGNQERVVRQALKDQGFDAEDIDTEVERYKNYGDLESVATKHHKVLVKKEASKMQQMQVSSEKELQQKQSIKNQYINNVNNIIQDKLKTKDFDGIPLNPKLAGELQDFLLVDKYKTNSGETLTDFDKAILEMKRPENHEMKVKVALLLKILEKDPTLSTIQKTGLTKKSDQLFGEVARQVTKSKTSTPTSSQSKSWFS
jgi:hypothetical protein